MRRGLGGVAVAGRPPYRWVRIVRRDRVIALYRWVTNHGSFGESALIMGLRGVVLIFIGKPPLLTCL